MKNNRIFACVLMMSLVLGFEARAGLKFGIPDALQKAVGWVQTTAENATKKVNEVSKQVQSVKVGDKIKGKYEQIKAMKSKLENAVAAGKEKYEAAQNAVASAKSSYESAKGKLDDVKGQYDAAMGTVQDTFGSPDATYEEQMDAIEKQLAENAIKSLETLEAEAYSIEQEMNNRKNVLADERRAIAKDAENNAKKLQVLYEQAETDEEKEKFKQQIEDEKALKEEYQTDMSEDDLNGDETYQQLKAEYEALESQIGDAREAAEAAAAAEAGVSESERKSGLSNQTKALIGAGVAAVGTGAVAAWMKHKKNSNTGGEDGYNSTINSSFVSADQNLTDEVVKSIAQARRLKFKGDIANALVKTINYRIKAGKVEEETRQTSDNMENADYKTTAISLDNEMVIKTMQLIQEDLALDVAKMRLKASSNLIKQGYRLNNPDKNPAQINLDQYRLTKDDVDKGKRS